MTLSNMNKFNIGYIPYIGAYVISVINIFNGLETEALLWVIWAELIGMQMRNEKE